MCMVDQIFSMRVLVMGRFFNQNIQIYAKAPFLLPTLFLIQKLFCTFKVKIFVKFYVKKLIWRTGKKFFFKVKIYHIFFVVFAIFLLFAINPSKFEPSFLKNYFLSSLVCTQTLIFHNLYYPIQRLLARYTLRGIALWVWSRVPQKL